MHILDGIAYTDKQTKPVLVSGINPLTDYKLWGRFNNREIKIFDSLSLF